MRFGIAFVFISGAILFSRPADAGLFPPRKTNVCIAAFRQIAKSQPTADETKYLLNSLRSFRENTLAMPTAQPSIDSGFISSASGWPGFSRKAASGRIAGIEHFMTSLETEASSQARFTQTASIQGKENIVEFLSDLKLNLEEAQRSSWSGFQQISDVVNAPLALNLIYDISTNPDLTAITHAIARNVLINGMDSFVTRPRLWDIGFSSSIDSAMKAVDSPQGGWALLSRNYEINPTLLNQVRHAEDSQQLREATHRLGYLDSAPLLYRPILNLDKSIRQRQWVGLDMLFEKSATGEPELHIILRGSEKRPTFPKKETEKSKSKTEARPGIIPGAAPAP